MFHCQRRVLLINDPDQFSRVSSHHTSKKKGMFIGYETNIQWFFRFIFFYTYEAERPLTQVNLQLPLPQHLCLCFQVQSHRLQAMHLRLFWDDGRRFPSLFLLKSHPMEMKIQLNIWSCKFDLEGNGLEKRCFTCKIETRLLITAVSPMTTPVPWSNNIPSPIFAATKSRTICLAPESTKTPERRLRNWESSQTSPGCMSIPKTWGETHKCRSDIWFENYCNLRF